MLAFFLSTFKVWKIFPTFCLWQTFVKPQPGLFTLAKTLFDAINNLDFDNV